MNLKTVRSADPFARVSKTILDDPRLSWGAKGIAAYLVGKPNGWKMRITDLVKHGTDGKHAIRAAINELRKFGYARYTQPRKNGRLGEGVWEISDQPLPQSENQEAEPDSDFQEPDGEEPVTQHHSKNDSNKKDSKEIDRAEPEVEKKHPSIPSEEDVKEYAVELRVPILTAQKFHDHYEAIGWKIGGSRIVDWEAKFRNWVRKDAESKSPLKTQAAGCTL